jgi:hypothetical protein
VIYSKEMESSSFCQPLGDLDPRFWHLVGLIGNLIAAFGVVVVPGLISSLKP